MQQSPQIVTRTRDLLGYAGSLPDPRWPGGARVAVSIVVNFEEGAEFSITDGDPQNEAVYEIERRLADRPDPAIDSHFEYGSLRRRGHLSRRPIYQDRPRRHPTGVARGPATSAIRRRGRTPPPLQVIAAACEGFLRQLLRSRTACAVLSAEFPAVVLLLRILRQLRCQIPLSENVSGLFPAAAPGSAARSPSRWRATPRHASRCIRARRRERRSDAAGR